MDINELISAPKAIITPGNRQWKWRREGRFYKTSFKLALRERPEIQLDLHITCAVYSRKISIALIWNRTERIYGIDIGERQRHVGDNEVIRGSHKHVMDRVESIDANTLPEAWTILCEDCNINYEGEPELPADCMHEQGDLYDEL